MKKISIVFGIILILFSVIGLAGFLLVNWWQYISDLFVEERSVVFYKIVSTENAEYYLVITLLIGLALIAYGRLKNARLA
jgi:spore maturation protein CgeB